MFTEKTKINGVAEKSNNNLLVNDYKPFKSNLEIEKKDNPYFLKLKVPHLDKTNLLRNADKINIILHPLYEMLLQNEKSFDLELYNTILGNRNNYDLEKSIGLIYCEEWLIKQLNMTINESKEGSISLRYVRVLEMFQEYKFLKSIKKSEDTYLFVVPKFHNFTNSNTERNPELFNVIIDIINDLHNKKTLFIESNEWSDGGLNGSDIALMELEIQENSQLLISGGYVGKCMDSLISDLKKPSKNNSWDISIDIENSTPVLFFDDSIKEHPGYINKSDVPTKYWSDFKLNVQINTIDDVTKFLEYNSNFYNGFIQQSREYYKQNPEGSYVNYK